MSPTFWEFFDGTSPLGGNIINHVHGHTGNGVVILPTEPLDTFYLLGVDTPTDRLVECLTPWGFIFVPDQPIGYLFEIPPVNLVEFLDNIK